MSKAIVLYSLVFFLFSTQGNSQNKNKTVKNIANEKPASIAEWTVLVFMNADNNLEPYAIQNFLDMAKVKQ